MIKQSKLIPQAKGVKLDKTDRNNCTVRALANAVDWTTEQATNFMREFGRQTGKGMSIAQFDRAYIMVGFTEVNVFGKGNSAKFASKLTKKEPLKGTTLKNLLAMDKYKKGTHIVIVTGHALCIENGEAVDHDGSYIEGNTRVVMTYSK